MNIDFHLYGTYLAALIAGCDSAEAKKIAFSAQMVDDFTESVSNDGFTATSPMDIVSKVLLHKSDKDKIENLCKRWIVFHFMPGIAPNQEQDVTDKSSLFCALGGDAVNYLIGSNESPIYGSAVSLGIGCHMYADIYAHMCFSGLITGTPAIAENVYIVDKHGNERESFLGKALCRLKDLLPGGLYMGHGIAGHYPDISTARLKYVWKSTEGEEIVFTKDNIEYFACAFSELIRVIQKGRATYTGNTFISNENCYNRWYNNIVRYLKEIRCGYEDRNLESSDENDDSFKNLLELNKLQEYCTQEEIRIFEASGIELPSELLEQYNLYKKGIEAGNKDKEEFEARADVIMTNILPQINNLETKVLIDIDAMINA